MPAELLIAPPRRAVLGAIAPSKADTLVHPLATIEKTSIFHVRSKWAA
ncbi:MAG: hypothetical protein H7293_01645 [Candidatus Saccharibacteria bacterium]|nr:hypothetical protein [Rhodoferax sp.]